MFASAVCGATASGSVICFHLLLHIIARKQVCSDAVWQPVTFLSSFYFLARLLKPLASASMSKAVVKHTTSGAYSMSAKGDSVSAKGVIWPAELRCTRSAAISCQRESLKSGLYAGFRVYGMAACLL